MRKQREDEVLWIRIQAYDHNKRKPLFTAKADFGPSYLDVSEVDSEDPYWNTETVCAFLDRRALQTAPKDYADDLPALEKLKLADNKHLFGRMKEAYILLAMLDDFALPEDAIKVHPLEDTIVSMIDWDVKYAALYLWKSMEISS